MAHARRTTPSLRASARAAVLAGALALGLGCASPGVLQTRYDYFARPAADDPWSRKIGQWQDRERLDRDQRLPRGLARAGTPQRALAPVAEPGSGSEGGASVPESLRAKFEAFHAESRRSLAREIAGWIQTQARTHYVPDGPVDRWATLADTLRSNGDDCDGLELLTYHLLRGLGFARDEVYRAIVYRRDDGQHHMVTLWFEDREDPWVIDPTGAMTAGMPRMSEMPQWVPLKVFSEDEDYTVERHHFAQAP